MTFTADGLYGVDSVDLYNSASGAWSTAQLSVARGILAATSVGNVAIFAGGLGNSLSNAVDLYNSASGTWSTAQLSERRMGLAATSVGNVAIFAGGYSSNSNFSRSVEGLLLRLLCVGDAWLRLVACCCLCLRSNLLPSHAVHCRWG